MKKLLHKGIYGIITKGSHILLVKKSRGPYINFFDLPGGRAEEGESEEQTLIREIIEETGVVPKKWEFFDKFNYHCHYLKGREEIDFEHQGVIYRVTEYDQTNLDLNIEAEDVKGVEWRAITNLEDLSPFAEQACQQF